MRLTGSQRGFSLIELLVAVFVIVLLTGVVSLNVGRGGAELELEREIRSKLKPRAYALKSRRALALAGTTTISRYRKPANFGC